MLGLELPGTAVFDFPTPSALAAYCVAQLRPSQAADHAAVQLSRRMLVTSDRCHDLQYLPEYMCKHLICAMIHVGHVAGRGMQLCAWMLARRVFQVSPLVWPTPQSERPWSAGMWMPRMFQTTRDALWQVTLGLLPALLPPVSASRQMAAIQ